MDLVAMESQAYQELIDRLNRIEQYVERTSHLLEEIDNELELSTQDLIETLMVSDSTLYRWRKKNLIRYRYTDSGEVRYFFKPLLASIQSNRLRISGMSREELVGRLNCFKENLIRNSCLNSK